MKQEHKEMIEKHSQTAIDIQSASNLAGVVHTFVNVLTDLWEISRELNEGTDWVNHHPISVLFASKISSLTNVDTAFSDAYSQIHDWLKETKE